MKHHLLALASETRSGIQLIWWIEKLIAIREREEFKSGPAFTDSGGNLAKTRGEYDNIVRSFIKRIQADKELGMMEDKDNVDRFYGFHLAQFC